MAQHIMAWTEGVDCFHKKEQITALPTPFMSSPMAELVQKLGTAAPCWPMFYAE